MNIQLYHYEPSVKVLGPGTRAVLWLQGCPFRCPGCLAPETHDIGGGEKVEIKEISDKITALSNIEGVTFSGGEPFLQYKGLYNIIDRIKERRNELSVMIFTGYRYEVLKGWRNPFIEGILRHTDILVDGPYIESLACNDAWRGSSNQKILFLSKRYGKEDYLQARRDIEIHINGKQIFIAGIPSREFLTKLDMSLQTKGII